MRKAVALALLTSLSVLVACRPEREVSTKFVMADHEGFMRQGTSTVEGQGFLRQRGGNVVRCSGEDVMLVPATAYFREYSGIVRNGEIPKDIDRLRLLHSGAVRRTICDADGKFRFEKIPAGKWLVSTRVRWVAGDLTQGGLLLGEVEVAPNGTGTVILSDRSAV